MTFVDKLKAEILSAIKAKDEVKRNILKLVLGEAQTIEGSKNRNGKPLSDEEYYALMRQLIESNRITLSYSKNEDTNKILSEEFQILNSLIPVPLGHQEIEAMLLDSDGNEIEQIIVAKSNGQAIGIAMKFMKSTGKYVLGDDVKDVVNTIRSNS